MLNVDDDSNTESKMSSASWQNAEAMLARLIDQLIQLGKLAVAFSGGVDSTVVVAVAARALGTENVLAVTADSETLPRSELDEAADLAKALGVPHQIIETHELDKDEFRSNPPERCYHCKTELWQKVTALAAGRDIIYVADGVNADDNGDFRPGIKAGDEAGVLHPLAEAGLRKTDVRNLARVLGLPNWNKPAQACLSSRFSYGSQISSGGLQRVESAEQYLREQGFKELRVRDHGDIARIEVPAESFKRLMADGAKEKIVGELKKLGYVYVTLDLEGFRSGSMNETLRRSH